MTRNSIPPKVEYALTDMGKALGPSMAELIDWAFMRRERMADELTP